jgi:hypothetical protein
MKGGVRSVGCGMMRSVGVVLDLKMCRRMRRMLENRGAFYDVSAGAERPLRVGEETLFVNGSIMTVNYQARNAPWVVDMELPVSGG